MVKSEKFKKPQLLSKCKQCIYWLYKLALFSQVLCFSYYFCKLKDFSQIRTAILLSFGWGRSFDRSNFAEDVEQNDASHVSNRE